MLKKAKVHIYTLDDHEGYICIDVDGVALYEHFVRGVGLEPHLLHTCQALAV